MPVKIINAISDKPISPVGEKKLFVKSYGCQMNVYDGLRIVDLLRPLNYTLQDSFDGADLVILNTCHIREKSNDKVFSDIGRIKRAMADDAIIAVGGCVGQALGDEIMSKANAVSIVFGPQTYHRLPKLIEQVEEGRKERKAGNKRAAIRVVDVDVAELEKFDELPIPDSYGPSSFLTIQEGCDKFCSYCVVPYTRGAEISRPVKDIVDEAKEFVEQGTREVVLLGQNVSAYHGKDVDGNEVSLAKLMEVLANVDGIERLRFVTSHPYNMTQDLIDAFRDNPKVMPYFHLPVQAGSDKVLNAMNRTYTVQEYLKIIDDIRSLCPDIAMSGDFIVGFPSETEEDFQQTLEVAKKVEYSSAYVFMFSARPGTSAEEMEDDVPLEVKKERHAKLLALTDEMQYKFNQRFLGKIVGVLGEELGFQAGQLRGKSPHNVSVNFTTGGDDSFNRRLIGKIVEVEIEKALQKSLVGKLL